MAYYLCRVFAKLIDEHLSHEIGQLVSVKGVFSVLIVPSGRCVQQGRESVEDLKPTSLHNLASHLIRHEKVMAHRIVAPISVAAPQLCGWIGTDRKLENRSKWFEGALALITLDEA